MYAREAYLNKTAAFLISCFKNSAQKMNNKLYIRFMNIKLDRAQRRSVEMMKMCALFLYLPPQPLEKLMLFLFVFDILHRPAVQSFYPWNKNDKLLSQL